MTPIRRFGIGIATALVLIATGACGSGDDDTARSIEVLSTSETILGQTITYPGSGPAEVSSSIITLQPGEETGSHHHETPLFAYILEGSLIVDYGLDGDRVYEAGDALMEAIGTVHNGRNEGDGPVRILVVNFGAEGLTNTVIDD